MTEESTLPTCSSQPEGEVLSTRRQGRLRLQNGSSASISVKRENAPTRLSSPTPPPNPDGWKNPAELQYIDASAIKKDEIIDFLLKTRVSIPGRPLERPYTGCVITSIDGTTTTIPPVYRIPLLFVLEFQWWSVRLVLGVENVELRRKEWEQFGSGIYHVARLANEFLVAARKVSEQGAMSKKWRWPQLDRALTRYRMGWMLSIPEHLQEFYEIHGEEPYRRDPLASHWKSIAKKGHNGFTVSEEHIDDGVTADELSKGLQKADGDWRWVSDPNVTPAISPSSPPSASSVVSVERSVSETSEQSIPPIRIPTLITNKRKDTTKSPSPSPSPSPTPAHQRVTSPKKSRITTLKEAGRVPTLVPITTSISTSSSCPSLELDYDSPPSPLSPLQASPKARAVPKPKPSIEVDPQPSAGPSHLTRAKSKRKSPANRDDSLSERLKEDTAFSLPAKKRRTATAPRPMQPPPFRPRPPPPQSQFLPSHPHHDAPESNLIPVLLDLIQSDALRHQNERLNGLENEIRLFKEELENGLVSFPAVEEI